MTTEQMDEVDAMRAAEPRHVSQEEISSALEFTGAAPLFQGAPEAAESDPQRETFDIEDLRLGEIATIERISGQSIKSLSSKNAPQGLTMQAIIMVVRQRKNPRFNLGDAALVSLKEFNLLLGDDKKKKKKGASKN